MKCNVNVLLYNLIVISEIGYALSDTNTNININTSTKMTNESNIATFNIILYCVTWSWGAWNCFETNCTTPKN